MAVPIPVTIAVINVAKILYEIVLASVRFLVSIYFQFGPLNHAERVIRCPSVTGITR